MENSEPRGCISHSWEVLKFGVYSNCIFVKKQGLLNFIANLRVVLWMASTLHIQMVQ